MWLLSHHKTYLDQQY